MQCACFILSSLVYPALKYPTVSNKRRHLKKKNTEHKICLHFLWKISHFKEKWARYDQNFLVVFMSSICYSCPSLTKLEFSRQISVKYLNIELHANPSFGRRVVPCGRTEMTKPIVACRNFATAPNSWLDAHNARSSRDCLWAILLFTVTMCWIVTVAFIQVTLHEIFSLCYVPLRRSVFHDVSTRLITPICKGHASFFLKCLTLEDGTDELSRNVGNYQSTPLKSQKDDDFNYIAVAAWIRA
jgi:hypothetical protein